MVIGVVAVVTGLIVGVVIASSGGGGGNSSEPVTAPPLTVPAGSSKLGTTRGAAEGLLIVGCGYLSRYRTHGWAEAPLKVLLRRWAHGNARMDAIRA